jgi:hypothetical protein
VEDSTNGLLAAAAARMVVIARPNREYPPEPDALALAALVVESLDELTPDAIDSAAQRASKQAAHLELTLHGCLLSGVKRTSHGPEAMSAYDPSATSPFGSAAASLQADIA